MLALLTVAVLMTTERTENVADTSYTDTVGLPVWAYPAAAAVIFLSMLLVTLAFRDTGKRH